jgi:hypothetical protein
VSGPPDGATSALDSALVLKGKYTASMYGLSVAAAGDQDGDGLADVFVAAAHDYAPDYSGNAGAVYLLRGPLTDGHTVSMGDDGLYGTVASQGLGINTASGDLDGDGISELAAAFYWNDGSASDYSAGGVVVVRGPVLGAVPDSDGVRLTGEGDSDAAGYWGMAVGGDVDGDGLGDLAVSALTSVTGEVPVVYLVPGPVDSDGSLGDLGLDFRGVTEMDQSGKALSLPGDLDGDGYGELLVGAPSLSFDSYQRAEGMLFVLHGPLTGAGRLADAPDRLLGSADAPRLGDSVDAGPDVNGDGRGDIIVSAPGCSLCSDAIVGHVVLSPVVGAVVAGDVALASFRMPDGSRYGPTSVDFAGDMDGDGGVDLAVGDRNAEVDGERVGAVYFVFGAPPP